MKRYTRKKRGAVLAVYTLLLPFAVGFLLLTQTRIETALLETKRHAARTQARLLAESALSIVAAQIDRGEYDPDRPIAGVLEGAGEYRIERVGETEENRFRAVGAVEYYDHLASAHTRTIAEIEFGIVSVEERDKPVVIPMGLTIRVDADRR